MNTYEFRGFHVQEHLVEAFKAYAEHGHPVGDFLRCVIENDLLGACSHADGFNIAQIPAFAGYVFNELPSQSHGSPAKYLAWIKVGGLVGYRTRQRSTPLGSITAVVLALALVGCGGGGGEEQASTECRVETTPKGELVCIFDSAKRCVVDGVAGECQP